MDFDTKLADNISQYGRRNPKVAFDREQGKLVIGGNITNVDSITADSEREVIENRLSRIYLTVYLDRDLLVVPAEFNTQIFYRSRDIIILI